MSCLPHPQFAEPASLGDEGKGTQLGPTVCEDTDISPSGGGNRTQQGASAQEAYSRFISRGESCNGEKCNIVILPKLLDQMVTMYYCLLVVENSYRLILYLLITITKRLKGNTSVKDEYSWREELWVLYHHSLKAFIQNLVWDIQARTDGERTGSASDLCI